MPLAELTIFVTSAALLLLIPGPTNALMMTSGALVGIRRSIPLISFEIAGYLLAILPLLALNELASEFRKQASLLLQLMAAVVTIATAARLWQKAGQDTPVMASPTALGIFLQTFFNPKAIIFAFSIMPPMLGLVSFATKIVTFTTLIFVAATFWIVLGAGGRSVADLPKHWISRISSLVLTGYAAYFIISAFQVIAW